MMDPTPSRREIKHAMAAGTKIAQEQLLPAIQKYISEMIAKSPTANPALLSVMYGSIIALVRTSYIGTGVHEAIPFERVLELAEKDSDHQLEGFRRYCKEKKKR